MKRFRKLLKPTLITLGGLALALALLAISAWVYLHPPVTRKDGIVYGQRHSRNLTLDVLKPAKPNGLGIIMIVSGGWHSGPPGWLHTWTAAPLLRHGYTVFMVCHVSQPEATVTEIAADINRSVRFIRYHARDYGVDPDHLGVTGASAGGHLSLLLATRGGPGPSDAPDPVDRENSAVQAVAVFFPVTDLLNLGASTENPGNGGPPKTFAPAFGPGATNLAAWKIIGHELSPIYYIHTNEPPVLIFHGSADTLVPLDQSQRFQTAARASGDTVELVVRHGRGHGWVTMFWDLRHFADWFDRYLPPPAR